MTNADDLATFYFARQHSSNNTLPIINDKPKDTPMTEPPKPVEWLPEPDRNATNVPAGVDTGKENPVRNEKKRAIALATICAGLYLLVGLFPPLSEEHWLNGAFPGFAGPGNRSEMLDSRFFGYGFLFNRKGTVSQRLASDGRRETVEVNINWPIWFCEWIGVTAATLVLVRLRLKKRTV
jgi:hypothetical protein